MQVAKLTERGGTLCLLLELRHRILAKVFEDPDLGFRLGAGVKPEAGVDPIPATGLTQHTLPVDEATGCLKFEVGESSIVAGGSGGAGGKRRATAQAKQSYDIAKVRPLCFNVHITTGASSKLLGLATTTKILHCCLPLLDVSL